MITRNEAFNDLAPLTYYLNSLEQVVAEPTRSHLATLMTADGILSERTALSPKQEFVSEEGWRTYGFESHTLSDGIEIAVQKHLEGKTPTGMTVDTHLRAHGCMALQALGTHLAVSGAFTERHVPQAYVAVKESLDVICTDESMADFAKQYISRELFGKYVRLQGGYRHVVMNPISKSVAKRNIEAAWDVVGKPYRFPLLHAWLSR